MVFRSVTRSVAALAAVIATSLPAILAQPGDHVYDLAHRQNLPGDDARPGRGVGPVHSGKRPRPRRDHHLARRTVARYECTDSIELEPGAQRTGSDGGACLHVPDRDSQLQAGRGRLRVHRGLRRTVSGSARRAPGEAVRLCAVAVVMRKRVQVPARSSRSRRPFLSASHRTNRAHAERSARNPASFRVPWRSGERFRA